VPVEAHHTWGVRRTGVENVPADRMTGILGSEPFFLERPRLGDLLTRKGLITPEQLADALEETRTGGELLGRVLIRRGYVFGDDVARTLAEQLNLPYVNLEALGIDPNVARMLPVEEGQRAAAIPVAVVGARVRVVFADPCDENALSIVQRYVPPPLEIAVGELSAIESAWRHIERRRAGA
jgi:MSHA biogenesis protein MshE